MAQLTAGGRGHFLGSASSEALERDLGALPVRAQQTSVTVGRTQGLSSWRPGGAAPCWIKLSRGMGSSCCVERWLPARRPSQSWSGSRAIFPLAPALPGVRSLLIRPGFLNEPAFGDTGDVEVCSEEWLWNCWKHVRKKLLSGHNLFLSTHACARTHTCTCF